jgi:hypothetical protein
MRTTASIAVSASRVCDRTVAVGLHGIMDEEAGDGQRVAAVPSADGGVRYTREGRMSTRTPDHLAVGRMQYDESRPRDPGAALVSCRTR